jgi:hypothetical protein
VARRTIGVARLARSSLLSGNPQLVRHVLMVSAHAERFAVLELDQADVIGVYDVGARTWIPLGNHVQRGLDRGLAGPPSATMAAAVPVRACHAAPGFRLVLAAAFFTVRAVTHAWTQAMAAGIGSSS